MTWLTMPEAMRLKGFRPGTIVASKKGRDRGTVYMVIEIEDPFSFCSDGKRRQWPGRMKKKRLKHLVAIDEVSQELMSEFDAIKDSGQRNKWIQDQLREKKG